MSAWSMVYHEGSTNSLWAVAFVAASRVAMNIRAFFMLLI